MNKKKRLILGTSVVVVLLGYLALSSGVATNQYDVGKAASASETLKGNIITVNGSIVKGSDHWDSLNRTLIFKLTDGNATIDVVYTGDKPDLPPDASNIQAMVTGEFNNNSVFESFRMLTKCPSKYASGGSVYTTSNTTSGA